MKKATTFYPGLLNEQTGFISKTVDANAIWYNPNIPGTGQVEPVSLKDFILQNFTLGYDPAPPKPPETIQMRKERNAYLDSEADRLAVFLRTANLGMKQNKRPVVLVMHERFDKQAVTNKEVCDSFWNLKAHKCSLHPDRIAGVIKDYEQVMADREQLFVRNL